MLRVLQYTIVFPTVIKMRLAYGYLLVIALCLLMVSDAFDKEDDDDLDTVSIDWIVYKNKLLNVVKRCVCIWKIFRAVLARFLSFFIIEILYHFH